MVPAFNARTLANISNYIQQPSHALLLIGSVGVGKMRAIEYIAENITKTTYAHKITNFRLINTEGLTITIDMIREVIAFTKLKQSGIRIIAIHNVQFMNDESQNALLKLLEEPPENIIILLSIDSESKIKQTLLSRVEKIQIRPFTKQELMSYLKTKDVTRKDQDAIWAMSGGRIRLADSLIDSDSLERSVFQLSKTIVRGSTFDRLKQVDSLSKQPENLELLLFALRRVVRLSAKSRSPDRLQESLQTIYDCEVALQSSNPNIKLLLTKLMLGV